MIKKAQQVLKFKGIEEISLAIVPEAEMQKVNSMYRGKDAPTDVLAFDYGEIVLCPAYSKKKYGLQTKEEVRQKMQELFVHALAHIGGYGHESEREEKEMGRVEKSIMNNES